MTKVPLFSDLKNDARWWRNLLRLIGFLLLFIVFDLVLSIFLLKGIDRFYGLKSNADVLMLGHSHLMLAIDKQLLEESSGLKVAKYTREGVNMADRRVMAQQYFSTCSAKPEIVILSIDPWLFTGFAEHVLKYCCAMTRRSAMLHSFPGVFCYLKSAALFKQLLVNSKHKMRMTQHQYIRIAFKTVEAINPFQEKY